MLGYYMETPSTSVLSAEVWLSLKLHNKMILISANSLHSEERFDALNYTIRRGNAMPLMHL